MNTMVAVSKRGRISLADKELILALAANGKSYAQIAEELQRKESVIEDICEANGTVKTSKPKTNGKAKTKLNGVSEVKHPKIKAAASPAGSIPIGYSSDEDHSQPNQMHRLMIEGLEVLIPVTLTKAQAERFSAILLAIAI